MREVKSKYAILGMLSIAPMSGYDIKKQVETSISNFWSESYGQIYPALRNLARSCGAGYRRGSRRRVSATSFC
jgi:DNA-binding PadR family transcriptional regulator